MSANDTSGVLQSRLANLESVIQSVERFERRRRQKGLEPDKDGNIVADFLRAAALRGGSDAGDTSEPEGAVTLMSIHAAKGLEFPCVLLVGLEEDLLPHKRSIEDVSERAPISIAEERRLFYVGMTRAKKQLHISFARQRSRHGRRAPTSPSRFLSDLPKTGGHVLRKERRGDTAEMDRSLASEKKAADFFAQMRATLGP